MNTVKVQAKSDYLEKLIRTKTNKRRQSTIPKKFRTTNTSGVNRIYCNPKRRNTIENKTSTQSE